jgi:ribosomal protein S18 acetylase RimI-like enzyme
VLTIAAAEPKDAKAILAVQTLAFQAVASRANVPSFPPLSESVDELQLDFSSSVILKAVWGRQLVGSLRGRSGQQVCEIRRMAVHPAFHGRGIGAMLLAQIKAHFAGVAKYGFFASTHNTEAIRLYSRHGYSTTGVKEVSPSGPIVFMERLAHAAS